MILYSSESQHIEHQEIRTSLVLSNYGQVRINDCLFLNCISNSMSGGGIYVSNRGQDIKIEQTLFNSCIALADSRIGSEINGGAIFFVGNSAEIISSCGENCLASWYGQFCYMDYSHLPQKHSFFNMTSVCQCPLDDKMANSHAIWQSHGLQNNNNINSTLNKILYFGAGLAIMSPIRDQTNFCQFSSNQGRNLLFCSRDQMSEMDRNFISSINIINNTVGKGAIFLVKNIWKVTDSVFASNEGPIATGFWSTERDFNALFLSVCFFDFIETTEKPNPILHMKNCVFNSTATLNQMDFLSTEICFNPPH